MISKIPIAQVPRRRGRNSPLAPFLRLARELRPGEALRMDVLDLDHAERVHRALHRMLRYHGIVARIRTQPDALYVWREKP